MRKILTPLLFVLLTACGGTATPLPATPTATVAIASPTVVSTTPTSAPPATASLPTATRTPIPATPIILSSSAPAGTATGGTAGAARPTLAIGTATGGTESFSDPRGYFTFLRPKAWAPERQSDPDIVVQLNSDRPPGSFSVATETIVPGLTLSQYVEAGVTQVRKDVAGYQPGPRGITTGTLGGEPASIIDYYATAGGTKLYYLQIIVLKDGTAYVLTFNTQPADQDAYLAQAQIIVDSWRFLPTP